MNPLSTAMLSRFRPSSTGLPGTRRRAWSCSPALEALLRRSRPAQMRSHPDKAWQKALFERAARRCSRSLRLPQPAIARVQGVAVAAGCQLVSMCDLRWRARPPVRAARDQSGIF